MNLHYVKKWVMWYMHLPFRIEKYKRNVKNNLIRIRQKEEITVVFFASNVSMWRYQGLWEEMQKLHRFKTYIVLSPLKSKSKDEQIKAIEGVRKFFDNNGMNYYDYDTVCMKGYNVKRELKPDIIFFPQPYYTVMVEEHRYYNFTDSLLCYCPYSFLLSDKEFDYNEDFQNRAWILFYPTEFHKEYGRHWACVKDDNIVVTGYPSADDFKKNVVVDVWKPQSRVKKRIIWAPHFTIYDDGWFSHTGFLWMADFMLELAEKYKERIQIAFKPHPKLKSELYTHNEWGKEKTDIYYKKWQDIENGQLETAGYVQLFRNSDAMIHDSGSFVVEYHYTGNPVLFISKDFPKYRDSMSNFGKLAIDMHYVASTIDEIVDFVENVVLTGNDPLKEQRSGFAEKYLYPNKDKKVAELMLEYILKALEV